MRGTSATPDSPTGPSFTSGLAGLLNGECLKLVSRLRQLGVATTIRRYEAGADVFLSGEPADGLYVLDKGLVKLFKAYPGVRQVCLRLVGPQEVFGDLAPGIPLSRSVRAHAFTDCEVTKVPKIFVERAVRTDLEAAAALLALAGLELAYSRELAGCLLAPTTEARLAILMTSLAENLGTADGNGGFVLPPLTHFDVAGMVAATRESVTAAMRSLRARGLLRKEGRIVTILDPVGLADVAAASPARTAGTRSFSATVPPDAGPEAGA